MLGGQHNATKLYCNNTVKRMTDLAEQLGQQEEWALGNLTTCIRDKRSIADDLEACLTRGYQNLTATIVRLKKCEFDLKGKQTTMTTRHVSTTTPASRKNKN